jgi:hypothetical protein
VKTSLPPRAHPNPLLEQVRLRSGSSVSSPAIKPAITPPVATRPEAPAAPVPSASSTAPAAAGQAGAPAWATPAYFHGLQKTSGSTTGPATGKPLAGGSGLSVRLGAMTTSSSTGALKSGKTAEQQRATGLSLLAQVKRNVAVIAGRPLTADEIKAGPALHYTRPENVASILSSGLRPTEGLYKNLTTWAQDAVYMFPREASPMQKFMNFTTEATNASAVVEIDLTKLDPNKLYKRVLDGALIYVSDTPIPPEALRVRTPA